MSRIPFEQFAGAIPLASPHLLGNSGKAQTCLNCDFKTGKIIPFVNSLNVKTAAQATPKSFYDMNGTWLTFPVYDVSVVRAFATDESDLIYYTDNNGLHKTTKDLATSGDESTWPTTVYPGSVEAPAEALTVEYIDDPGEANKSAIKYSTAYRYTRVTQTGDVLEESAPSPAILADIQTGYYARLANFDDGSLANILYYRIYRSVAGNVSNAWRLVDEIDATETSYDDTILDAELPTTILPSLNWDVAPDYLTGLSLGPSNCMFGWVNNELHLAVPDYPHAWQYSKIFPDNIVAAVLFGTQTIIVLTEGLNHKVTGSDPGSMSQAPIGPRMPCIGARAVTAFATSDGGSGVIYAAQDGPAIATPTGNVLMDNLFTKDQWQALSPADMIFLATNNYVYCISKGEQTGENSFRIDMRDPTSVVFFTPDGLTDTTWTVYDARTDGKEIYFLGHDGTDYRIVKMFGGTGDAPFTWKSGVVRMFPEQNMGAIQFVGSGLVRIKVFSKYGQEYARTFNNSGIDRLPAGYTSQDYSIEVSGEGEVESVVIASSVRELTNG